MSKLLAAENLVKILAVLLLALLTWEGKCLCTRISSLERNQTYMMGKLGIPPIAAGNPPKQGLFGVAAASEQNPANQKSAVTP
jgi:hypothetical protein